LADRYEYLSNAVLQARSGSRAPGGLGLSSELSDSGLMELLEGKLAVLRFQQKIKEALDRIACGGSADEGGNAPMEEDGLPFARAFTGVFADESRVYAAREKSEELGTELKSITQLYNDYACRFELWEVSGLLVLYRGARYEWTCG
jgi:nuclear pore complex protein Nup155